MQIQKRLGAKEQHLSKTFKLEQEKQEFFKNKSAEKFNTVLAKKRELDQ